MTMKKMDPRNLAFLLSEASGHRSRSNGIIPAGTGKVLAGTVLGQITATAGHFAPSPDGEVADIAGAENATAVLGYGVDATDTDVAVAMIDADAEINLSMLTFDASVDDETKIAAKVAQLKAVGIRAR